MFTFYEEIKKKHYVKKLSRLCFMIHQILACANLLRKKWTYTLKMRCDKKKIPEIKINLNIVTVLIKTIFHDQNISFL